MILNVPLIRQPKNSVDCGIAGINMLLKYHERNIAFEDLKKKISVDEVGTYMPQLGTHLIGEGFNVEIVTMHPGLFTLKDKHTSQREILSKLKKLCEDSNSEQKKKTLNYFIDFLRIGGRIDVKIPDFTDIVEEINNKRPLCALLTSNILVGSKPIFNFHFNLITGYDNEYIFVNDPMWDKRGGKKKHRIDEFLYGVYTSAYGDLDNASFMKVKKIK